MDTSGFILAAKMLILISVPFLFRFLLFGFSYIFIKILLWIMQTLFGIDCNSPPSKDIMIPLLVYHKSQPEDSGLTARPTQDSCAICLEEFNDGETIKKMPDCGHIFHGDCITNWLKMHNNCPYCRLRLNILKADQLNVNP